MSEYPVPPPPPRGSPQPLPPMPSVASRYKRPTRRPWGLYLLGGAALVIFAVILFWALGLPVRGPDTQSALPRRQQSDPDLQAVRAWLKENTDGRWEEVEWFPAHQKGADRYCRLKYKEYVWDEYENEWAQAPEILGGGEGDFYLRQDKIFRIQDDGTVELSDWGWAYQHTMRREWSTDETWERITGVRPGPPY